MNKNTDGFPSPGSGKSVNDRVQMAMGLVYSKGFPVQLACWIMGGMKKQVYNELKRRIELMHSQMPEAMKVMGAQADKLEDSEVNRIIKQLKINGFWRDMPKAEYRDMMTAVKNKRLSS